MKVRKLKTRIAAFGLTVLMGVSTLSSANAFAAERTGSEQQTEVQAVTSQKDTSVTADDITKAVSDETFAVETCMEGIHYDAEKEDVTLVSIKDENGGEYHSDKSGTYIATYMVVPKDKSDSYTITRKVTLTDTEGQAHSEENGGEKQKSDTESEDDSDSPVQNYTDVEIETSEEDASAQAIKELKEDIEEGNVMVLSAAERATSSGSTVTLTKGRTIYYPSYIGNYLTCLFTVNGKIAYCLQSQKASPPSGSYVAQVLDSNKNLQKVLYYGCRRIRAYLNHRGISDEVITYCISHEILYESVPYHNAVFVGKDESRKARYAFLRGIYEKNGKGFKMEQTGSEKKYSFCIPPERETKRVVVYEACIDALAHMTLEEGKRDKYRLSLGGIAAPKENTQIQSERFKKLPDALEEFLKNHPEIKEIEICTDNDFAGRWAKEQMKKHYEGTYQIICNLPEKEGADYADLAKEKKQTNKCRDRPLERR